MTIKTLEKGESLFGTLLTTTKDKVVSLRVEESLYDLLEQLSEQLETENVSQTIRKIIYFYLLNSIYEEEWKTLHSRDFEKFIQKAHKVGNRIELNKYKNLLGEISVYMKLIRTIANQLRSSENFFSEELDKLELAVRELEKASIYWSE